MKHCHYVWIKTCLASLVDGCTLKHSLVVNKIVDIRTKATFSNSLFRLPKKKKNLKTRAVNSEMYICTCTCTGKCVFVHMGWIYMHMEVRNESNPLLHTFSIDLIQKKIYTLLLTGTKIHLIQRWKIQKKIKIDD